MFASVALAAHPAAAGVITIDDGAQPGVIDIPFTCSVGDEGDLWLPSMGFIYRNVEPFELRPGDTIAFDIQMQVGDPDNLGFLPQVDIGLAHASDPLNPFKPDDLPGSDFTIVGHGVTSASPGNRIVRDYDLAFTVDAPFSFPGGGLIIRINHPQGVLTTKRFVDCLSVITADIQPSGTNRLVGTFKLEAGEYPWKVENTTNMPAVPYVRIIWSECGDGRLSPSEQCDNSATPDKPDPFCDSSCHLAAFAKGSGCNAGAGGGLALVLGLLILVLARRRRSARLAETERSPDHPAPAGGSGISEVRDPRNECATEPV